MPTTLQFKRGNTAVASAFTGEIGEIYINTTTKAIHTHDGVTAGGAAMQTAAGLSANVATLTANNTSYVGSVTAANVVSNSQLSSNLANYQTTAGLSANVAKLTANNTLYLGGIAANQYAYANQVGGSSGPTNYFKGLQILEDVYEAVGAQNIIFESSDDSVLITRGNNVLNFRVVSSNGSSTGWYSKANTNAGATSLSVPADTLIDGANYALPQLIVFGDDMSNSYGSQPTTDSMSWEQVLNSGTIYVWKWTNPSVAPAGINFETGGGGVRFAMAPSWDATHIGETQFSPNQTFMSSVVNKLNGVNSLPYYLAATSEVHGITVITQLGVTATAVNCTIHETVTGYSDTYVVWSMTKAQSDLVFDMADMITFDSTVAHSTYYWWKQTV